MPTRTIRTAEPFEFQDGARRLFEQRIAVALGRARRYGSVAFAAVTAEISADLDLSAVVLAARRPDDRFACFEQPDRDRFALAALGQAATVQASGPDRFSAASAQARELGRRTFADDPAADSRRPPAAGPVFVGGFAFSGDGGSTHEWGSLAPALLVLPEVALVRQSGEARMTCLLYTSPSPRDRS